MTDLLKEGLRVDSAKSEKGFGFLNIVEGEVVALILNDAPQILNMWIEQRWMKGEKTRGSLRSFFDPRQLVKDFKVPANGGLRGIENGCELTNPK